MSGRLVALGEAVPEKIDGFKWDTAKHPGDDPEILNWREYPESIYVQPGEKAPNSKGLASFGAYVNAIARRKYGRPLFIACAADLADSTNISGFAKAYGDSEGFGWYRRGESEGGALLPQAITEFSNAGIMCGLAGVNFAADPEKEYVGYYGACSTYGSFSYLKYGPMRLFSQLAQDSQLKTGSVLWIGSLARDPAGNLYLGGQTNSIGLASPGAAQSALPGNTSSGVVLKLVPRAATQASTIARQPCTGSAPPGSLVALDPRPTIGRGFRVGSDDPTDAAHLAPRQTYAFWLIALTPLATHPCGLPAPGLGPAGGAGELLVETNGIIIPQPVRWSGPGSPATFTLPIPCHPFFGGATLYTQGAFYDTSGRIVLGEALDLTAGW